MRNYFTFLALLFTVSFFGQNESGVDESNIILYFGPSTGNEYFNLFNSGNTNFNGLNFGTFECDDTFILNGAQQLTHKCGDHNISYSELNYSIQPQGNPHTTFTVLEIFFNSDLTTSNYCSNTSIDQNWQTNGAGINVLSGLIPGTYELQVYTRTEREDSSGSLSDMFISNFGANFTATFTVIDSTAPVLVGVPSDITVQCDAIPAPATVSATDNCDATLTVNYTETSNTVVDGVGSITREWSVTDNGGNTTTETQTITVIDSTAPTIICPADVNAQTSNDGTGNCTTTVNLGNPTVSDNCTITTNLIITNNAPAVFPVGLTVVTWTVMDAAGNLSTCTQNVTITDDEAPTVSAANNITTTTSADGLGNCTVNVSIQNASTFDNCSVSSITWSMTGAVIASGNGQVGNYIFPIGVTTIEYIVTDSAGLTAQDSMTITVTDDEDPDLTCPSNQNISFDAGCNFTLQDYTALATTIDNCDNNVTVTQSPAPGTIHTNTITVTLTATDASNNSTTCQFSVIPSDTADPVAVCQDYTLALGPNGVVNLAAINLDGGSSDNCGIANMTVSPNSFNCSNIGPNTVTFTVFDNAGNSDSCTATVNIVDNTPPVALCSDFVVVVDAITRLATITAADIDNGSNDACGVSTLELSQYQFPDNPTVYVAPVTLTVTDVNGNVSTCTANVTVEPPKNLFTYLTGVIVNPVPDNPQPPSELIEVTACISDVHASVDVALTLSAIGDYNLQPSQVLNWEYSNDNGETWIVIPNTSGILNYTLTGVTSDTFVRLRIVDADDALLIRTSAEAYIRFLPPDEPPVIVSFTPLDICLGDDVTIVAESYFDQPNGQFGEGGEFNYAQPDGWRVDGIDNFFPASGNNTNEPTWKESNSNNNVIFSGINYDVTDNTKFAIAHGVGNVTTLETPVFSTIGMTASEAILSFDTSFYFCNGGFGVIELSFDSGNTYSEVLTAYNADTDSPIAFTDGNDSGIKLGKGTGNKCIGVTDPRMLSAYINLGQYAGLSGLRVRFTFNGSNTSCGVVTETTFPNPDNINCNSNNGNALASGWAIDGVGFAYAQVDDELEWTEEDGEVIAIGTTATITPVIPGKRIYGVTNLVNGCRADNVEGTNFIEINASLAYAGEDYLPLTSECGENALKLNAYDNTRTVIENYNKGAWTNNLYQLPSPEEEVIPGTGVTGQWSVVSATNTSCGNSAVFEDNSDPDTVFIADPGDYTLRWTLSNGCFDEINVRIVECSFVNFDGINDHISFRNNYNLSGMFSIEAWVKPNSIDGLKTVFSKKEASSNTSGYDLSLSNGQVQFNWYNATSSGSITTGSLQIDIDRWYHLAITFNGGIYSLYVDGILINTVSGNAPAPTGGNVECLVGAMDQSNPNEPVNYYHGWIDELKIWNKALSAEHIRQMMNQEITSLGTDVGGVVIPTKIYGPDIDGNGIEDDVLLWSHLIGYYRMDVVCGDFMPYKGVAGRLRNMTTSQEQTAPIPYTSRASSPWTTDNTWTNFQVWNVPNSIGINGDTIDWNIVRTSHNISSSEKDITVLGLLVNSGTLTIANPTSVQDENNDGQMIWVTHYLRLNGKMDLIGESQLIQKRYDLNQFNESILETSSTGFIERDQQGTTNLFNYNYWGSPVGAINNSTNNTPFSISSVLHDGTNSANPVPINWTNSYNATGTTNPITLSNRWLYAYENYPINSYASWRYLGSSGFLNAGLGFTMKGSGVGDPVNDVQNYVFVGKPNNGLIEVDITNGNQALVGNPYPSAIDAFEFIKDNLPGNQGNAGSTQSITGSLYFWEHYESNNTHILSQYEGGYGVFNLTGGLPTVIPDFISGAGTSTKTPGQYIPVGQGFFVESSGLGSKVRFRNNQRFYEKEDGNNSVFFRSNEIAEQVNSHQIKRIRFLFNSHNDGFNRPLLLGFTSNDEATDDFDFGYDAFANDSFNNDMSFLVNNERCVIQGVGQFDITKIYPLSITLSENTSFEIGITEFENFDVNPNVFVYDALLGNYFLINNNNFEIVLDGGTYNNRFFIAFSDDSTLDISSFTFNENIIVNYFKNQQSIFIKAPNLLIDKVKLFNLLGQEIEEWNRLDSFSFGGDSYLIPIEGLSEQTYIIQLKTEHGNYAKKIIINY